MNSISRYITRQVLMVTIFVILALCFAIWLTQSLRLVDLILNRGLPLTTFLHLASLLFPRFLMIVVPIAVFSATLFTYNKLITDSELVVMRTAGLSNFALARPGLLVAILFSCFTAYLTVYLLPTSFREFKDLQFKIRTDFTTVLLQEGVFNSIAKGITVYVRKRDSSGQLHGIMLHDSRKPEKPSTMMAETGALVQTKDGPRVVLVKGNRQEVDRERGELSLLYFDRYTVDIKHPKDSKKWRWREPRERYLDGLFNPTDTEPGTSYANDLLAEGHNRIILPILPLTYCAIGIAVILAGTYNRRGQLRPLLITIAIMTVILVISLALRNMAAKHPTMIFAMYANALIPLVVALYFIFVPRALHCPPNPPAELTDEAASPG